MSITTVKTVKTITRAEVSFWWHNFFVREGFYYGEILSKNENGGLEYTHFVSNGNVHDGKLSVYFHIGTPEQTQKWVFVGEAQRPYGLIGKAYWKKRAAYETINAIIKENTYYSVHTCNGVLFYTDPVDAWAAYDGERSQGNYAVLTEYDGESSVILAEEGEVV